VSDQYEVVVSCFLDAATPEAVLDEVRWHLGLLDERPEHLDEDEVPYPALEPSDDPDGHLPGGEFGSLQFQARGDDVHEWGLYVRLHVPEGALDEVFDVVDAIAPHVAHDGYGGHVRAEDDEDDLSVISFGKDSYELVRR
jgi:hypothetical protein